MSIRTGSVLFGVVVLAMAGCREPERVIERLPPPYHEPVTTTPPSPFKPTPAAPTSAQSIRGKTIVVDPGHGGADPGTLARFGGVNEKVLTLAIAREVIAGLTERGARVVPTRNSDVAVDLDERAAIADRVRADLLVSIHIDASDTNPTACGAKFYIAEGASQASQRAALKLDAAFRRAGIESRGIDRRRFRVLVAHHRPAVLIECGFVTNRFESQQLNTAAYRSRLAEAIVAGIVECFGQ